MRRFRYMQLDVFTSEPFGGNQLAVFFDATSLTSEDMQRVAREMNFSESVFTLPAREAKSLTRLRIFTPQVELPFAGHPIIGATFALAAAGRVTPGSESPITLDLGIGPLDVDLLFSDTRLSFAWMRQRNPTFTKWTGDRAALAASVGLAESDLRADLPIETGSAGVPHTLIPVVDAAKLDAAKPGANLGEALNTSEPCGAYFFVLPTNSAPNYVYSRMFGPHMGIAEDAATGSAAGPVGAYLVRHGLATIEDDAARVVIAQGVKMGRPSRIVVNVELRDGKPGQVRVGGEAVVVANGEFLLPDERKA